MQKFLRIVLFMACLLVPWAMRAQETVTIGTGTSNGSSTPFSSLWGYSFVEQVYLAEEIGMGGNITSISFYLGQAYTTPITHDIRLYMKNVTRSTFADNTDYETVTADDVVYDGQWTITGEIGWITIELDTPFPYDGSSNLLVAMHEFTSGYSTRNFQYSTVTNSVIRFYSDSANPDPYNLGSFSGNKGTANTRSNIQLEIAPLDGYCPKPANLAARNLSTTTVTIGWSISEMFDNVSSVTVEYGEQGFTPGEGSSITVTDIDSIDLTNLTPGTRYQVFAFSDCSTDGTSDTSWTSFKTYGLPIESLPYYTGFEEGDDVAWDTYNGPNGWYIDTVVNNTEGGNMGLYISNDNGTTNAYTITTASYSYACRPIQLEAGSYALSFDWKAGGEGDYDYIRAFLIPASTPPTANTLPDGQTATQAFSTYVTTSWVNMAGFFNLSSEGWQADTWQTAEVVGTVPTAGLYLLTIAWINDAATGTQPPAAIDNINFYQLSCAAPVDLVFDSTSISSDGFSFSWTPVGNEGSWQVRIDNGEWETVNTPSYDATGLTSSSRHMVYVRAVCSATDLSFSLVGSCRTLCGPINHLPYTEGFEDNAANSFPQCWYPVMTRVNGSSSYPFVNANFHNSGTRCLYAYPIATNPIFIASQAIDLPPDMIHVSFAARLAGTLTTTNVQAGLMTSTTDTSTFIPLCTVTGNNNVWTEEGCEFYSDAVEIDADSIFVAFRFGAAGTSGVAECIDDIIIEEASDCRRPVNPVVLDYDYSSITYGWTDNSDASDGYIVRFGTTNNVDAESNTDYEASDNELTIEDLQPSTTYYAWVATSCGGELTSWRALPAVTTQQICYSVQNASATNIGLTTAALVWNFSDGGIHATEVEITVTNQSVTDAEPITMTTDGTSVFLTGLTPGTAYKAVLHTHCEEYNAPDSVIINFSTGACGTQTGTSTMSYVPLYGLYNYGYSQALYPASMVAAIDTITGIQYELNTANAMSRVIDIYIGYTDMTTFTTTSYVPVSQLTQVVADRTISLAAGGWVNIPFDNAYINNGGGTNLVVAVVNKTGTYNSFSWKAYPATAGSCVYWYQDSAPYDLNNLPVAKGASAATLPNIRFNGNCDISGCMASNMLVTDATTESLQVAWVPNGSEELWLVRHRTPNGEWEYSEELTESPYIIDGLNPSSAYEVALGSLCGDEDTNYTSLVAYTDCAPVELPYYNDFSTALGPCWNTTTVTYNAAGNIQFTAAGSQAILPEMPLNNVMVTLGLRSGAANNKLKLGVTSNNGTTVQWLDTITSTSTTEYVPLSSTLNGYEGDATRLVLACGPSTTSLYIDFISVSEIPECMPIEGIASSDITGHTATISWDESIYSEFQLRYHIVGQPWVDSVVNGTPVELTGLAPVSNYQVQVRPICTGGDTTFWAQTSFTTPCANYETPFFEDFNATTIPGCWARYTGLFASHPSLTTTTAGWNLNTNNVMDGTRHMKINIFGTSCKYWLVTPNIEVGEDMSLSFDLALTQYNQTGAPTSTAVDDDKFIVAVSTDDGANWTKLAEWSSDTNNGATSYISIGLNDHVSIDLAEYAESAVRIAFYGESTVTGADLDLHIDNVLISIAGCDKPTNTEVSDISYNGAYLSWEDNSTLATGYEVRYGTANDVNDPAVTSVITGTPGTILETLQSNTVYYAWVRTLCGEGNTSPWSTFGSFRTPRTCYPPVSYTINSVGYTTASFGWTFNADSTAAGRPITATIVEIVNLSDTNADTLVFNVVDTNGLNVADLTMNTDYRVYLTTECLPDSSSTIFFPLSTDGCGILTPGGVNMTTLPMNTGSNYGYSQSIYSGDVLAGMDTIRGISYYINETTATNPTRTVSIFMANTTRTSLDTNNYVPIEELDTMVATYTMDVSHTGWTNITFDTFFVWDGTSDVLVALLNSTGSNATLKFKGHQTDSAVSVFWYRSTPAISPSAPNAPNGTTLPNRGKTAMAPDIRFLGNCNLGTCLPPMLVIDSTTTNTAYITLTASMEDDTWVVAYRPNGTETWSYDPASGLTNRVITGLQHSTLYEFRAGSICSGDTLWSAIQEEFTACDIAAVPMVENFDNGFTPCWLHSGTVLFINTSTNDLYVQLNSATSYMVTPVIDASIDTVQVRVSWRPATANKMLRLGTVDANGGDLVWLDSASSASTTEYAEQVFFVANYAGTTTGRRFVLANAVGTASTYITSVIVESLMDCPPIRDAVASSSSQTTATLDWTDISSAGSWDIEYGPSGFEPGTGTSTTVTSHPTTISGLEALSVYDFYITPGCAEGDDDLTLSVSVTTAMCDDLVMAQNWTDNANTGTSSYSPIGYSLYNYSYVQTIIDSAQMANMAGNEISAFQFLPNTVTAGSEKYTNMNVYMANVSESSLSSGFIKPDTAHTFVHVIVNGNFNFSETEWQTQAFDSTFVWDGHSNVLFAVNRAHGSWASSPSFKGHISTAGKMRYVHNDSNPYDINTITGGTANSATVAVGDIRLLSCGAAAPTCDIPTITGTEVTETTVTLNFTGTAENYEVAIVNGAWSEPATTTFTTGNSYTFNGLNTETEYTVAVRAICDDELISDWEYVTVTTLELSCPAPNQVTVDEVHLTTATVSWTLLDETQTAWQVNVTGLNFDQNFTANANTYQITGLTPDVEYTVKVRAICGESYSDWSPTATFTTGICQGVSNVTASNVTSNSATISWTAPEGQTSWVIDYGAIGHPQGTGTTVTVNTNPFTLTGLTEYTPYDVYVRAVCEDGIYSDWSPKANFTTLENGGGEGISDVNSDLVKLFPNPANTTVTIDGISGEATVSVVDMNGRTVFTAKANETLTIDLTGYAQGAYFVRISGEQTMAIRKLIVK